LEKTSKTKMKNFDFSIFQNKFFLTLFVSGVFAFTGLLSAIADFSFLFAFGAAFIVLATILFFQSPLSLLFLLVISRMSLDYSSHYVYFQISKNLSISLSQFIGILIAILGIFLLFFKRKQLKKFPLYLPFLLIIFWGTATLSYSISLSDSLQELVRIFGLLSLCALAYVSVKNITDFKNLILSFFISSLLPIAFSVYQLAFNIGFQDDLVSIPRIFGTFSHPNVLSMYLFGIIVLAFLYAWKLTQNNLTRLTLTLFICANLIILYLTYTRIAWIALILFFGAIGILRFRKILLPLVFIPIILFFFSQGFRDRIEETLHPSADSSIVWRKLLWKDTVGKTIDDGNKLLGSGINTFPLLSESTRGTDLGSNEPHNDFVKFFVEGGLLGLGVFLLYLGMIVIAIRKQKKSASADSDSFFISEILLIFFLAMIVSSLSDNIFKNTPLQWIFWIALGGFSALKKIQAENVRRSRP
jgi:putative inorganic carbon (hco3(-)) transporter